MDLNVDGDLVKHQVNDVTTTIPSTLRTFQDATSALLGGGLSISRNVGERRSVTHSTTGIPYAIAGTATLVEQRVSARILTFKDPIKALLGVGIHRDERIIIKRKYVASAEAIPVPEHASARTVSMQEEVREVQLTRFGHDLEMNLNLFLRPDDAAVELEMKLEACQIALENALIVQGYDQVMEDGVDFIAAISRSLNKTTTVDHTELYSNHCFGIFAKSKHPIASLMIGAKMASAYSVGTSNKALMIVPFMTPEIMKYSKSQWTTFDLSGIPISARDKLDLSIPGGFRDELAACTIYQHIPPVNIENGVPNPCVKRNLLSKEVVIYSKYVPERPNVQVYSYKTGDRVDIWCVDPSNPANILGSESDIPMLRRTVLKMSSAILGVSGKETGELLHAYSSCGVSTNPTTELGRLQLRAWLGAVIYKPENILIIPEVAFESVISDEIILGMEFNNGEWGYGMDMAQQPPVPYTQLYRANITDLPYNDITAYGRDTLDDLREEDEALSGYRELVPKECSYSYVPNGGDRVDVKNNGPIGILDCPMHIPKINGTAPFTEFISSN